jgi:preprotein translocase subunit SecF
LPIGEVRVQPAGEKSYILKQRDLTPDEKAGLVSLLEKLGPMTENRFTSIGPALGAELRQKAWIAITLVILAIILFITFAFRHVSKPVASWKYGIVTILTLVHDILIPMGLFALLGHLHGAEVDTLFIIGLLTILGLSINDTIVVFDRIRENLRINEKGHHHHSFEETVWKSIIQTITRSINTSLTVVIVLLALYFLGPVATRDFSLMLIVGMVAGTYSSILLAAPTLVAWEKWARK